MLRIKEVNGDTTTIRSIGNGVSHKRTISSTGVIVSEEKISDSTKRIELIRAAKLDLYWAQKKK